MSLCKLQVCNGRYPINRLTTQSVNNEGYRYVKPLYQDKAIGTYRYR